MGNSAMTEELRAEEKAVLLIPGMVSNALEARTAGGCFGAMGGDPRWRVAWVSPTTLAAHPKILGHLKLEIDSEEEEEITTRSKTDREVRVVEGLDGIAVLNPGCMAPPITLWRDMIYKLEDEYSVVPFNYDWRRWGDVVYAQELVDKFQQCVELCYNTTQLPVTILGHSMGAPVAHYCMSMLGDAWVTEHIDEIIHCGPAFGTPTMFPSFSCGPVAGMFDLLPESLENKLANITSTWPCMTAEFPLDVGDAEIFDKNYDFVTTPTRSYKFADIQQFLEDTAQAVHDGIDDHDGFTYGTRYYPGCEYLSSQITPPPASVPVHFIYAAGVQCPTRFKYSSDDLTSVPTAVDTQAGDNTVLASSVEKLAQAWRQAGCQVQLHKAPDGENHSSLIKCEYSLDLVADLLEGCAEKAESREIDPVKAFSTQAQVNMGLF